jgi:hypothetical protein
MSKLKIGGIILGGLIVLGVIGNLLTPKHPAAPGTPNTTAPPTTAPATRRWSAETYALCDAVRLANRDSNSLNVSTAETKAAEQAVATAAGAMILASGDQPAGLGADANTYSSDLAISPGAAIAALPKLLQDCKFAGA